MSGRLFPRSTRAVTVALAVVLVLIAGFAVASAFIGREKSLDVVAAALAADRFDDLRTMVGDENVLADRYASTPTAAIRTSFDATAANLDAALHIAASAGPGDAAQADIVQMLALHERYTVAVAEFFDAIDAGERAQADAIDSASVDPAFDELRTIAIRLERRGAEAAAPRLANLATISTIFAVVTPLGFLGGLALLWLFWRELRRIDALERRRSSENATSRTRSALLASMSHELRTPLNAILGFSELVLEGKDLTERQRVYLQNVRTAGQRLLSIVNAVLAITNIESGGLRLRPEVMALSTLLEPVAAFGQKCASDAHLTFVMNAMTDAQLIIDVSAVRQIITNLLASAARHTPAPGELRLSASVDESALLLDVADTGVGMPPETAARVLEPFEGRGAPRSDGMGADLGLALVKRLVEAQGGRIEVESAVGAGTTFRVRLPSVVIVTKAGARLLIVDDEQADAGLVSALAWEQGLFVEIATTVARALSAIVRELPLGVVLDLRLPDGRGEVVLAALRALPERVPVAVVTVEDPGAVPLDVDEFITKPLDAVRLRAWLARTSGITREAHANTPG